MSNLRLCDTILNNTQNSTASLDTAYPKSDRTTFSYYRGRLFLYQRRLPQARNELKKAFALCSAESWSNGRYMQTTPCRPPCGELTCISAHSLILTYLIAASLPLGYFPSMELLEEFDLDTQYRNLLPALRVSSLGAAGA